MPPIQIFIAHEINSLLNSLSRLFNNANELAFYSLQGKNELQIRDKIAWYLQQALDRQYGTCKYIVRREWSPKERSKVDLAVLKINGLNTDLVEPIALIEFKAHSFVNKEQWPYAAFLVDIKKMYDMVDDIRTLKDEKGNQAYHTAENVDMYYIFLHSTQNQKQTIGGYKEAIAYVDILNHSNTICPATSTDYINYWKEFYNDSTIYNAFLNKKGTNQLKHYQKFYKDHSLFNYKKNLIHYKSGTPSSNTPNIQSVGAYMSYEWFITPFIWGPYKRDYCPTMSAFINVK